MDSSKLIDMAVSLAGSAGQVIACMNCSDEDFRLYREGLKEPPWSELDRLIALIVREQGDVIAKNRELLDEIRARRAREA